MAAALSLLGEINNALNPQPRTPRGQAWVEAVMGRGVQSPHGALRAGRLDQDLCMGWVPQPSQAGGAVIESHEPPKTQPTLGTPRMPEAPCLCPRHPPGHTGVLSSVPNIHHSSHPSEKNPASVSDTQSFPHVPAPGQPA